MAVRILCTGDIHIGRRASKVPETYRCADAWRQIVDLAIAEQVDAVAISGDLVDKESKSYEAMGPLESGLQRLGAAGIIAVAISGNHDFDVLHRLAKGTGSGALVMLGAKGTWERYTLTTRQGEHLHIDGWSFPAEHVARNPLHEYRPAPKDATPVLGMVHCDVGVPGSRYAPVSLHDLTAHSHVDLWLLGHIHIPRPFPSATEVKSLYPGSPLAMDPGEPGAHGVWIVEFGQGHAPRVELRSISPMRYLQHKLDVSHISDEASFRESLGQLARSPGRELLKEHQPGSLRYISCRVEVVGRNSLHQSIKAWSATAATDIGSLSIDGTASLHIDAITCNVLPEISLEAYAQSRNPAGEAARLILRLREEQPGPPYEDLIRSTVEHMNRVYQNPAYAQLQALEPDSGASEDDARTLLEQEAWALLSTLVSQRESA